MDRTRVEGREAIGLQPSIKKKKLRNGRFISSSIRSLIVRETRRKGTRLFAPHPADDVLLAVIRHSGVCASQRRHVDKRRGGGGGGSVFFFYPYIHVESEFEQLHRTIAFTNMTYNNCGSSTVQPKVHKVCFSEEQKKKRKRKVKFFTMLKYWQLNIGLCVFNCNFNTIPTSV